MKKKIALLIATSMLASMTGCNIAYESELPTDDPTSKVLPEWPTD